MPFFRLVYEYVANLNALYENVFVDRTPKNDDFHAGMSIVTVVQYH